MAPQTGIAKAHRSAPPTIVGTVATVGFATPEEAALAGDRVRSEAFVLAQAATEGNALVVLMSPGWPQPDWVACRRGDDGWAEGSSGDCGTLWSSYDDGDGLGVLASWGEAEQGAK